MGPILVLEIICYFGLIGLEVYWQIHRVRNEQRFALLQVATPGLIMITVILFRASPEFPFGLLAGSIVTIVFAIVGYLMARWIYRQVFPPK